MAKDKLIKDTEFLVIDFETLTPKGHSPEPIELGVQKIKNLSINMNSSISWLIKPPNWVDTSKLNILKNGIKPSDLLGQKSIDEILIQVNNFCTGNDYVFIAQNARYEANILSYYTEKYRAIAKTPIIDTILLGKHALPDLPNYKLDTLAYALNLKIPKNRHRALPDSVLTAQVFLRLLEIQKDKNEIIYLDELLKIAEIKTRYNQPEQINLFNLIN